MVKNVWRSVMTTQRDRATALNMTRVIIFIIGMFGTLIGILTQSITLILLITAVERSMWLWYHHIVLFELRMLDKWRDRS